MVRPVKSALFVVIGSALSSVAVAQTITTIHRPGVDFSGYHSYKWVSVKSWQHTNPAVDAQIKRSIDSQLSRRGLRKTEDGADLAVDYQIAESEKQAWQTYEDWTATGLMDQRLPKTRLVMLEEGTLVLDIYDARKKELVWSGSAKKTISHKSGEEDKKRAIDKAAEKLLTKYPPK